MYSGTGTAALPAVSFLIRKSWDRRMVSSSPRLIASAHVLHRLSVPRHPPSALVLLIRRTPVSMLLLSVFAAHACATCRSLKTHWDVSSDCVVVLGSLVCPLAVSMTGPSLTC